MNLAVSLPGTVLPFLLGFHDLDTFKDYRPVILFNMGLFGVSS